MNSAIEWLRNLRHRPALLTILANNGSTLSFTLTSLVSVPFALHYLSKKEFGLWAFTNQSIGYFLLLDLGISMATARLVAAPLTSGDQTEANRWFSCSLAMMMLQGLLMVLLGFALVGWVLAWFDIPAALMGAARALWLWILCSSAVNYLSRSLGGILYAQNRFFWKGFGNMLSAWVGLGAFIFFLDRGAGVMAYAYSSAFLAACSCAVAWLGVCLGPDRFRLDFRDMRLTRLRELYGFSGALFVTQLASLVLVSGQTLIVTKMLGLVAAGGYNVSAKVILTARGVLWQLFESFLPGWQRLYLKGQIKELLQQWRLRFDLVLSTALVACTIFIAVNRWFVAVWARPDMFQGFSFDLAAALFCLATVVSAGYSFPQAFAMRVWGRAAWHLAGAAVSVGLGILLTPYAGTSGVFWAGTIAIPTTMIWYNVRMFRRLLARPAGEAIASGPWKYVRPLAGFIVAASVILACRPFAVVTQLIVAALIVTGTLGLFLTNWKSSLMGLFQGRFVQESVLTSPELKTE